MPLRIVEMLKRHFFPGAVALALSSLPYNNAGVSVAASSIKVGDFTGEQLRSNGGGGCGMTLWRIDKTPRGLYLFFNGLTPNAAWIVLNRKMIRLNRTAGSGSDFYGQKTQQTFQSLDRKVSVMTKVTLGKKGEIESVALPSGSLTIKVSGQILNIPVKGDAGC
jgi:hypothetical protein